MIFAPLYCQNNTSKVVIEAQLKPTTSKSNKSSLSYRRRSTIFSAAPVFTGGSPQTLAPHLFIWHFCLRLIPFLPVRKAVCKPPHNRVCDEFPLRFYFRLFRAPADVEKQKPRGPLGLFSIFAVAIGTLILKDNLSRSDLCYFLSPLKVKTTCYSFSVTVFPTVNLRNQLCPFVSVVFGVFPVNISSQRSRREL